MWQAHYQTFSVIFMKEFNVNLDMMIKTIKHMELNTSILEYANFKEDLIEYKCLCCNKSYQHGFDKRTIS